MRTIDVIYYSKSSDIGVGETVWSFERSAILNVSAVYLQLAKFQKFVLFNCWRLLNDYNSKLRTEKLLQQILGSWVIHECFAYFKTCTYARNTVRYFWKIFDVGIYDHPLLIIDNNYWHFKTAMRICCLEYFLRTEAWMSQPNVRLTIPSLGISFKIAHALKIDKTLNSIASRQFIFTKHISR